MNTSAGAGPVSLGLVTVLALLLTCRGQRRDDITQKRTFQSSISTNHPTFLKAQCHKTEIDSSLLVSVWLSVELLKCHLF